MPRAIELLGLERAIAPEELRREIRRRRAAGWEPRVLDLLPGVLATRLRRVCEEEGVGCLFADSLLGARVLDEVNRDSAALARRLLDPPDGPPPLGELPPGDLCWQVLYWIIFRRACLAQRVLEEADSSGDFAALRLLGGEEMLAGLLNTAAKRRGLLFSAPGLREQSLIRRQRVARKWGGDNRLLLPTGLAHAVKLLPALREILRPLPRAQAPVDVLLLATLPGEAETWRAVAAKLPPEVRWGVISPRPELRNGYPAAAWCGVLSGFITRRALSEWTLAYRRFLPGALAWINRLPALEWRGISLTDFARHWLSVVVQHFIWLQLPTAAALTSALDRLRPRLVIGMTERLEPDILAYHLARRRCIPTLALESHDMILDLPLFSRLAADRLAVSGEYARDIYRKWGVPEEKLVITGQPSFDRLAESAGADIAAEKARWSGGRPRLAVVITQPPDVRIGDMARRELLRGAVEAAAADDGLALAVKPHPRENPSELQLILDELHAPPGCLLPQRLDLYRLLAASDVVLTIFSTVGVEAVALRRPVVVYKPDREPGVLPYVDSTAVLRAHSAGEIAARVLELFCDPALAESLAVGREEYLAHFEAGADGRAGERVARLIESMLSR